MKTASPLQDEPSKVEKYASLVKILAGIAHNINARDSDKMTALMWIAASNNTAALDAVLKHNPDLDLRPPDSCTAMMWAACSHAEPAVEILRNAGSDASLRDSTRRSADEWLAWPNAQETGTTPSPDDDKHVLESLTVGRKSKLLAYLERHLEWNKNDRVAGLPPLHLAAALGDVRTINELL